MSIALIYPFLSWHERCNESANDTYTALTERNTDSTLNSTHTHTYTYNTNTHRALPLGWQSPHAFKIASALVGGLSVYFLLGGLITEYAQ